MLIAKLYTEKGLKDTVGISRNTLHIAFEEAVLLNCKRVDVYEGETLKRSYVAENFKWGVDSFDAIN